MALAQTGRARWLLSGHNQPQPVQEQPGHADQRELARILHEHQGLAPGRLCHLPVGFGDHHGELTGAAGGRWFST